MPTGTTTFNMLPTKTVNGWLREEFLVSAKKVPDWMSDLYEVRNTSDYVSYIQSWAGIASPPTTVFPGTSGPWTGEDVVPVTLTASNLFESSLTQIFWRARVGFTWKMRKFDRMGRARQMVSDFGRVMARVKQVYALNSFNQWLGMGYTGTPYWNTTAALPLFAAHVINGTGTTFANYVAGALSTTTLKSAILKMRQIPDDNGNELFVNPKELWVPPALEATAVEILNAGIPYQSGSGNYTTNKYISSSNITLKVCPLLTSTTACFMVGDNTGLAYADMSSNMESKTYTDDNTSTMYHEAILGFNTAFKDWRNFVRIN